VRRQKDIKPGFNAFNEWVETPAQEHIDQLAIRRELHYAYKHLPMIDSFFEDGRVHLDNSAFENKI
jgi:hypothetical protein